MLAALLAAPPAAAADLFSVAGVRVDAVADNAQAAQNQALAEGQVEALKEMFRKLTLDVDRGRLPVPDAAMVNRLVRSYEVTDERRSSQRYIAEMTVNLDPNGVRQALRDAGVPYAETASPPVLVLPVIVDAAGARLWDAPNPWREAWQDLDWRGRLITFALPYGELADLSTVTAEQALSGDLDAIGRIGARYDVRDVLVAVARPAETQQTVTVEGRRYGEIEEPPFAESVPLPPLDPDRPQVAFTGAAAAVAGRLEQAWIARNLLDFRVVSTLPVTVDFDSLDAWLGLRQRLAAISQIDRFDIDSLTRHGAELTLHFLGARERVADALTARAIALVESEPGHWRLEASDLGRRAAPVAQPGPDFNADAGAAGATVGGATEEAPAAPATPRDLQIE